MNDLRLSRAQHCRQLCRAPARLGIDEDVLKMTISEANKISKHAPKRLGGTSTGQAKLFKIIGVLAPSSDGLCS